MDVPVNHHWSTVTSRDLRQTPLVPTHLKRKRQLEELAAVLTWRVTVCVVCLCYATTLNAYETSMRVDGMSCVMVVISDICVLVERVPSTLLAAETPLKLTAVFQTTETWNKLSKSRDIHTLHVGVSMY